MNEPSGNKVDIQCGVWCATVNPLILTCKNPAGEQVAAFSLTEAKPITVKKVAHQHGAPGSPCCGLISHSQDHQAIEKNLTYEKERLRFFKNDMTLEEK